MSTTDKTVKVSVETDKVLGLVVNFISQVQLALSDGWQPGSDFPAVLSAVMIDLVPALKDVNALPTEAKEDLATFVRTISLRAEDLAFAILKVKA